MHLFCSSSLASLSWTRALLSFAPVVLTGCALSGAQPVGFQEQIEVGEQFIRAGQYRSAYAILDGISENMSTQPAAQVAVGDSYLRANALLRAEAAYRKAAQLGDRFRSDVGMGKVALKRNDHERATWHFRKALERNQKSAVAWNGLGVAYDLARNHSEAQRSYRQAIEINPSGFEAINNLGMSLILSGNSASAIETLTSLTESRLDSATTRVNLAIALHIAGYRDQAASLAAGELSVEDARKIFGAVSTYVRRTS